MSRDVESLAVASHVRGEQATMFGRARSNRDALEGSTEGCRKEARNLVLAIGQDGGGIGLHGEGCVDADNLSKIVHNNVRP